MIARSLLTDRVNSLRKEIEWEEHEASACGGDGFFFKAASYRRTTARMKADLARAERFIQLLAL